MLSSPFIMFHGRCMEALQFYHEVFPNTSLKIITFQDVQNEFGAMLKEEHYNLVYKGHLIFSDGSNHSEIIFGDSPSVLFRDPEEWGYGNTNTIIFDCECKDDEEVKRLYTALLNGGISNGELCEKADYTLYGSVIDRYNLCWNFYHQK